MRITHINISKQNKALRSKSYWKLHDNLLNNLLLNAEMGLIYGHNILIYIFERRWKHFLTLLWRIRMAKFYSSCFHWRIESSKFGSENFRNENRRWSLFTQNHKTWAWKTNLYTNLYIFMPPILIDDTLIIVENIKKLCSRNQGKNSWKLFTYFSSLLFKQLFKISKSKQGSDKIRDSNNHQPSLPSLAFGLPKS